MTSKKRLRVRLIKIPLNLSVPGGLKAPNVTVLSSTSVHLSWEPPALPNGIIIGYGLHQSGVPTVLFSGLGFNFTVTNLQPFTIYEFRVNASTIAGSGFSPWSQASTFEDGKFVPWGRCYPDQHYILR